jgi:6,7-dimethyl-8-ribityllumazine synthase
VNNSTSGIAQKHRFAVVISKFNEFITNRLLAGALEALNSNGVKQENITQFEVPGAFEIPQGARKIAESEKFDAIICLGAILRGETLHFELISEQCAAGIQNVAADFGIPVTFGVITADTTEQAMARSESDSDNKGREAALAAIQMADLYRKLNGSHK